MMRSIVLANRKKYASIAEDVIIEYIHTGHTGYRGHQMLWLDIKRLNIPTPTAIEGTKFSLHHRSDVYAKRT